MAAPKVKVALVVSGALSLGSFEAGVIAELLRAAQDPGSPVEIDVVGGASAGAITGAALTYYLTRGTRGAGPVEPGGPADEYPALQSWSVIDIARLTQYAPGLNPDGSLDNGLLARKPLLDQLDEILCRRLTEPLNEPLYRNDVLLFMTLASLHGLEQEVAAADDDDGIALTVRYRNHSEAVYLRVPARAEDGSQWGYDRADADAPKVEKDTGHDTPPFAPDHDAEGRFWYKIFNYSLTSASSGGGWAARKHYNFAALPDVWWPDGARLAAQNDRRGGAGLYFVDGGTVDNRPILKMLKYGIGLRELLRLDPSLRFDEWNAHPGDYPDQRHLAMPVDPDRLLLFVEPDPSGADLQDDSGELAAYDTFLNGAMRALTVQGRSQPNYADLEFVGELNRSMLGALRDTVDWVREAAPYLPETAHAGGEPNPDLVMALDAFLGRWVLDPKALEHAGLNGMLTPAGEDGGRHSPLVAVQRVLTDLRGAYESLGPDPGFRYRRAIAVQMAKYLERRGLAESRWIYIDRIAPAKDEEPLSRSVQQLGGFIDREWLAYDFWLGRKVALTWLLDSFTPDRPEWAEWRVQEEALLHSVALEVAARESVRGAAAHPLQRLIFLHPDAVRRMVSQVFRALGEEWPVLAHQVWLGAALWLAAGLGLGLVTGVATFLPGWARVAQVIWPIALALLSLPGIVVVTLLTWTIWQSFRKKVH